MAGKVDCLRLEKKISSLGIIGDSMRDFDNLKSGDNAARNTYNNTHERK